MLRAVLLLSLMVPAYVYAQTATQKQQTGGMQGMPTEPGQSAFAAIQEIVGLLEADPATDWKKVNIEALRQHLTDMNNVTLGSEVKNELIDGGMRFIVIGKGPVKDSIQRMTRDHAVTMNSSNDWRFSSVETNNGAIVTVLVPAKDAEKLRGLGFIGVMTLGMHHQMHHLMIATGAMVH